MEKAVFIAMVKKHQMLYDPGHEEFRNVSKKEQIWESIGQHFDLSAAELKRRWKALRDTYSKYVKRLSTESAPKEWIWARHMKFYRPFLFHTLKEKSYSNYPASDEYEDQNSTFNTNLPISIARNDEYVTSENDFIDDDDEVLFVEDPTEPTESPERPDAYAQMEDSSVHMEDSSLFNITEPRTVKRMCDSVLDSTSPDYQENKKLKFDFNEIECLLLAHAKTISKFSAKRQAITKYKIAQVILEQELLHLQECSNDLVEPKKERDENGCTD
ncbi:uncharacterized protein LOC142233071 [Haematobia irritans]|uniref:uncharacterized protein LOC142233071 n=1 Tax=Haematobia irritans TaxID=7368 RepID=UPI003F507C48